MNDPTYLPTLKVDELSVGELNYEGLKDIDDIDEIDDSTVANAAGDAPTKAEFDKVVAVIKAQSKVINALLAALGLT